MFWDAGGLMIRLTAYIAVSVGKAFQAERIAFPSLEPYSAFSSFHSKRKASPRPMKPSGQCGSAYPVLWGSVSYLESPRT